MFKKSFSKTLIFFFIVFLAVYPLVASADGAVLRPLPGAFDLVDENSQQAFINYEQGIEKLIIAVDIEKTSPEAVWLIPVPAPPQQVEVDIVSSLPNFFGEDIIKKAKNTDIFDLTALLWTNQLFLAGVILVTFPGATGRLGSAGDGDLVSIFQHLDKAGMTTEVIAAADETALYNYLSSKGLNVEKGALPALEQYIGEDYTFVASWISASLDSGFAQQEFAGGERGIFITFPTKKVYYPLKLTSVYKEDIIPIDIRVVGHMKPSFYPELKAFATTTYYTKARGYGRGARGSRCVSAMNQLRTVLTYFYSNNGVYPGAAAELKEIEDGDILMQEIEMNCTSFAYQTSPDRTQYEMRTLMLPDKEYMVNSEGFAGEQEIPPLEDLGDFYGGSTAWKGADDYTKISINAAASTFEQDLWMIRGSSPEVWLARFIILMKENMLIFYFVLNAVMSFLIGGLLGLAFFKKFEKYALVGLANLATLIGLIVAFYVVVKKTEEKTTRYALTTIGFVVLFSVCFMILSFVLTVGITLLL